MEEKYEFMNSVCVGSISSTSSNSNIGQMMGTATGQDMIVQMPNMMGSMGQGIHTASGGNMMGGFSGQNMMGNNELMMWNQPYIEAVNPQYGVGMMNAMAHDPMPLPPPIKQPFYFTTVTLYPPDMNTFRQSVRERPPCCHTVFVGGLPENITVDHLKEVFSKCGAINNLRINKKRFAHIRFDSEETVDHAIYLSGYRMVLHVDGKPNEEHENTGRMFVDYADDREDKYLAECQQRQIARELRHMQRLEMERNQPPSPTPVLSYTPHNMNSIGEDIKLGGDKLAESLNVLIAWLDRGDCNRNSVNNFYGIIQSVNVQVRRLHTDKISLETEINELKDKFRLTFEAILHQLGLIDQVYVSATKQKAWDNFSKAQRKNIQAWQKQVQATYKMLQSDYAKLYQSSEEMDMSDDEKGDNSGPPASKQARHDDSDLVELVELRQENRSLSNQLDAYKNEVEVLKIDIKKIEAEKESEVHTLQQAVQGMQQQLILARQNAKQCTHVKGDETVSEKEGEADSRDAKKVLDDDDTVKTSTISDDVKSGLDVSIPFLNEPPSQDVLNIKQAKLIGLMSCFLNVHPNGASIDYIWSYLNQMDVVVTSREVEDVLLKYPTIFSQHSHGVGAFLERRWHLFLFTKQTTSIVR